MTNKVVSALTKAGVTGDAAKVVAKAVEAIANEPGIPFFLAIALHAVSSAVNEAVSMMTSSTSSTASSPSAS